MLRSPSAPPPGFAAYVRWSKRSRRLVVQPRMGFTLESEMRAGLESVATVPHSRVGTITLDAYTRLGQLDLARRALKHGEKLNGFPIVTHESEATRRMTAGLDNLPVQVRHGSPLPQRIFAAAAAAGIDAIEGGPVSYCLPYGRVPLAEALEAWRDAGAFWAAQSTPKRPTLIETFGGCMMGQLCGPSELIALSLLEGLFFAKLGLRHLALSYAQGTSIDQDVAALRVLGRLAAERLPRHDVHTVFYTFMGLFPRSVPGARRLLEDSARVAVQGGAARLIVKTPDEAREIPTIESNVQALVWAQQAAATASVVERPGAAVWERTLEAEARAIIDAVLALDDDVGTAFALAFENGLLDVPHCNHPDNRNEARAGIDADGALRWVSIGKLPLPPGSIYDAPSVRRWRPSEVLLGALEYNRIAYDGNLISLSQNEQ